MLAWFFNETFSEVSHLRLEFEMSTRVSLNGVCENLYAYLLDYETEVSRLKFKFLGFVP